MSEQNDPHDTVIFSLFIRQTIFTLLFLKGDFGKPKSPHFWSQSHRTTTSIRKEERRPVSSIAASPDIEVVSQKPPTVVEETGSPNTSLQQNAAVDQNQVQPMNVLAKDCGGTGDRKPKITSKIPKTTVPNPKNKLVDQLLQQFICLNRFNWEVGFRGYVLQSKFC